MCCLVFRASIMSYVLLSEVRVNGERECVQQFSVCAVCDCACVCVNVCYSCPVGHAASWTVTWSVVNFCRRASYARLDDAIVPEYNCDPCKCLV